MSYPRRIGWSFVTLLALFLHSGDPTSTSSRRSANEAALQRQVRHQLEMNKLEAEVDKILAETANLTNPLLRFAPAATLVLAVLGAIGGWLKYLSERTEARRHETQERVAAAMEQLGSSDPHARIPAAISLGLLAKSASGEIPTLRREVIDSLCSMLAQNPGAGEQRAIASTLSRLVAGQKDLDRLPLAGADLSTVSFDGAAIAATDFSGSQLDGTSFKGASLERVIFASISQPNGRGVDFSGATLRSVRFSGSTLRQLSFDAADVNELIFQECELAHCSFANLKETGGLHFEDCTLYSLTFTGSELATLVVTGLKDVDPPTAKAMTSASKYTSEKVDTKSNELLARSG
ncbi:MAG TPA: pentapeptide repeat-containing protein [Longimicrobiaceae bacterium]|jgi:hypothetical protein